jgi:hypothetical protein
MERLDLRNVELRIANVEVAPIRHSKFDIRNLGWFMESLVTFDPQHT